MAALHLSPESKSTAAATVAATTSPQVIQNTGGNPLLVLVSGGTVSDISYGRDGTNYFSTGATAGQFYLAAGDYLQVTYSANPTMKAFSL